jgi:hypothetical protein
VKRTVVDWWCSSVVWFRFHQGDLVSVYKSRNYSSMNCEWTVDSGAPRSATQSLRVRARQDRRDSAKS